MVDFSQNNSTICSLQYHNFSVHENEIWCSSVWDTILCWPPTRASTIATQKCPSANGLDPTLRRCSENGSWEGRYPDEDSPNGWTNYTPCYTPEMSQLLRKLYAGNEEAAEVKLDIAAKTRTLEYVGLTISLAALLISLTIFCRFRSLRNTRTRIHKNLFVAMVIQVVIRLTLYIDQSLLKQPHINGFLHGINSTPILCQAIYVLLEYARTAMFMWMFVEGFYLHNMVTVTVFQESSYYRMYRLVGWGLPVIMTLLWAVVTALYYPSKCWWGYNLTLYFWILEGPRMAVILLNFLFLMNIVRVLVAKLRQSQTSETEQVRKAVRAAVVLLPLLGITNIISMTSAPLEKPGWFAFWSYTTHFFTSFQGLFISTIYCFFNGEVRLALRKTVSVWLSLRTPDRGTRRQSAYSTCQPQRVTPVMDVEESESRSSGWLRLCCRGGIIPPPDRPAETTV